MMFWHSRRTIFQYTTKSNQSLPVCTSQNTELCLWTNLGTVSHLYWINNVNVCIDTIFSDPVYQRPKMHPLSWILLTWLAKSSSNGKSLVICYLLQSVLLEQLLQTLNTMLHHCLWSSKGGDKPMKLSLCLPLSDENKHQVKSAVDG